MKILIFEWAAGTYTYTDIKETFDHKGIEHRTVSYQFRDKNEDPFFEDRFTKILNEDVYDAVFSVNYFPLVSKCCHDKGIRYISWSYDNPLDVPDIENTLGYQENHVFLFDRIQTDNYRNKGFKNVYHMPLAVNCRRLDEIRPTDKDVLRYNSDISFVGKIYDSMYGDYLNLMDEYCRGYIEAAMKAQAGIYGYYLIDELLNDSVMGRINDHFKELDPDTEFHLPKEALSYAMAAQITKKDRVTIMHILSKRYKLNFYSWNKCELLPDVNYMGSCGYLSQMPKVFKLSRINLNITLRILQSGIPLRALDIMGSGGFLLSNYQPELAEFFIDGREVVMYESIQDAIEKAIFYLNNDEIRVRIAGCGHDKVKKCFSYEEQIEKILNIGLGGKNV